MNLSSPRFQSVATLLLRLATAVNFLSPVAARLGWWGHGNWTKFLTYAATVNSFAPPALVPTLAVTATVLEATFALCLLAGFQTRLVALGASGLTLLFALAMSYSVGLKEALDYSVFVDSASALLLATMPEDRWSFDRLLRSRRESTSRP